MAEPIYRSNAPGTMFWKIISEGRRMKVTILEDMIAVDTQNGILNEEMQLIIDKENGYLECSKDVFVEMYLKAITHLNQLV